MATKPKVSFAFYLPKFESKAHAQAFAAALAARVPQATGVVIITTGQVLLGSSDPDLNTVEVEHIMLRVQSATANIGRG